MRRRDFIALLGGAAAMWPLGARAQNKPATGQDSDAAIGQVATLQGNATVTRGSTPAVPLKVADQIYKKDALQTGANSTLGVTFDDDTTFSLSENTRIVVDEFVYQEHGSANAATFNIAVGTAAFVASLVAKTGDMKITTPIASLGIRGTTGVVDVPQSGAAGSFEPRVKLYADADGHVGQIEVSDRQGARLGTLTQGASAFVLRPGAGGRLTAVVFRISPREAARDRGVLQRLRASHAIGRQMTNRRRQLRRNNQRRPGQPNRRPHQPPNRTPRRPPPRRPSRRP